ncbi:MAG: methylated-DNA--[protein]-cysteine S-methyltransferase [Muribaculaceae bacterium]|nr:methylated-DNA--[protein]-cysteine S-methyltransferase [Muribaculaceae bacterium]
MLYSATYPSPVGLILLTATETSLVSVQLTDSEMLATENLPSVMTQAFEWLDSYFAGFDPGKIPPVVMNGTPFQQRVWTQLLQLRHNEVITYGELARILGTSPRAVGHAVACNHIPIFIPCHRVVASTGLGGFSFGGTDVKKYLLSLEAGNK